MKQAIRTSTSFVLFVLLLVAAQISRGADRPNILFIAVDDLRPELGCYGQNAIRTPNIDRLAKSGVAFQRAYCQLAVCNPSRVSIMTGLRPDSTKVWDLVTRFRNTIPDAVTLPQHFKQHGYYAASFGKVFHNPWPDNPSWSEPHAWPPKRSLWSDGAKKRLVEFRKQMKADGKTQQRIQRMRPQATEIVDIPDSEHIDGAIAQQAIQALKRLASQKQPFFLAAGFVRPHLPFVAPRKYWDLYDPSKIPVPPNRHLPKQAPPFAMNTMYELRDYLDFAGTPGPRQGTLTEEQQRRLRHGYYASVSFIDSLVGELLDELKSQGLEDNTIIVLWGDHGWKLGEHNSWCKQSNYEIDTRVPLIVRSPRAAANGKASPALVELVDVYPTLCDLAGIPIPKNLEGRSLSPLLSGSPEPWKQAAFSQFRRQVNGKPLMGYTMRTDRFRYVEWQDRRTRQVVARELYDHEADPQENINVAGEEEHQKTVASLSRQMWTTLPQPPAFRAPQRRAPRPNPDRSRPEVTFKNAGKTAVSLFWLKPNGEQSAAGKIAPGEQSRRRTTLGHQFRITAANGYDERFTIEKQTQTITVRPRAPQSPKQARPNIVFCVADDWSWPHAGILGDPLVKTPVFDQLASQGVLFENAFVSTPSCTPSRLSILTGQHHWRLREGDSLGGSLRVEFDVYTDLLAAAGYRVGRFGKGVWPSKHQFRKRDSFGDKYRSFAHFLEERKPGEPFCYWHGGQDPHRPYEMGIGAKSGMELSNVRVPACLPDNQVIRSDVADYLWEVQRFDREVGAIVKRLKAIGEFENTIIVVSGDNGMPFPRCKATLYDQGVRVPLAVYWGAKTMGGRRIKDFVNLCDLAPTFLEAANLQPPAAMTGQSLMPLLESKASGQIDPRRTFAITGMERHVYLNPSRALRTKDFLYIRNFAPETWKTGEIDGHNPIYDFRQQPWPTEEGAFSFNIDPSPAKQFLRRNRTLPKIREIAALSFRLPPKQELYDLKQDPEQIENVADQAEYADDLKRLAEKLMLELTKAGDPRVQQEDSPTSKP